MTTALISAQKTVAHPDLGLRGRSHLHYTEQMNLTSRSPFGWLLDLLYERRA